MTYRDPETQSIVSRRRMLAGASALTAGAGIFALPRAATAGPAVRTAAFAAMITEYHRARAAHSQAVTDLAAAATEIEPQRRAAAIAERRLKDARIAKADELERAVRRSEKFRQLSVDGALSTSERLTVMARFAMDTAAQEAEQHPELWEALSNSNATKIELDQARRAINFESKQRALDETGVDLSQAVSKLVSYEPVSNAEFIEKLTLLSEHGGSSGQATSEILKLVITNLSSLAAAGPSSV